MCRDGKSWKFSSDYGGCSSASSKQQRLLSAPDRRTFNIGGYQDLELRAIDILNSVGHVEGSSNKTSVLANLNGMVIVISFIQSMLHIVKYWWLVWNYVEFNYTIFLKFCY